LGHRFHDWEVYAAPADSGAYTARVSYRQRMERLPSSGRLAPASLARQYAFSSTANTQRAGRLTTTFGLRQLGLFANPALPEAIAPERTLLSRIEHQINSPARGISLQTFYETGSGLQPKREFIYLEVPSGQGNFVWVDHNDNGIKELNEFEQTPYQYEANYIRTFVPSSDYVRAYPLRAGHSLNVDFKRVVTATGRAANLARKFAVAANYQLERNLNTNVRALRLSPFASAPDSLLNSQTAQSRATLFFQRAHATFSAGATYRESQNKQLLANGTETRNNYVSEGDFRYNFFGNWILQALGSSSLLTADSDFLSGRSFRIRALSVSPQLLFEPQSGRQLSMRYTLTAKTNTRGIETMRGHTLGLLAVIAAQSKLSLSATSDLVLIEYSGPDTGSTLRYEMLDGLQPGPNYLWTLTLQRILSESFQINLTYNGRTAPNTPTIHIGNFEARFFF